MKKIIKKFKCKLLHLEEDIMTDEEKQRVIFNDKMGLEEIKKRVKGYFIYTHRYYGTMLALRSDEDIKLLDKPIKVKDINGKEVSLSPSKLFLMRINNQILDPTIYISNLSEILPKINFSVFDDFDRREKEIKKHKELVNRINEPKSWINHKKESKPVYGKNEMKYYTIKDNEVIEIDKKLLKNAKDSIEVVTINEVKQALKDDFTNQHEQQYKTECDKWNDLIFK